MSAHDLARHAGRGLFEALAELGSVRLASPRDPRAAALALAGALGAIARAHDLVVTVRGEVPRSGALVVANHVSYLDPIALLPCCPAIPIAKHEVGGWPIVGPIVNALDVLLLARREPRARVRVLRAIHGLLARGVSVLNFPEGTTTDGGRVLPFWRGSFGVAQRLGVPVVPVAIRYADPALAWCNGATFLPHYLRMAARPRVEIALTFGAPMPARTGEPAEVYAARARGAIAHMLDPWRSTDAGIRPDLSPPRPDAVLPLARDADARRRGRRAPGRAA